MLTAVGVSGGTNKCSSDCPFCKDKVLRGYNTKYGSIKDEKILKKNLASNKDITKDGVVGKVFPLSGGGDSTTGWEAREGALEDFKVKIKATPHHLIPGKASMEPSRLETWTRSSKGKIKEDIGYNVDCAQNGIFLPHLPEIYFTKHKEGTKIPMSKYYGQTWSGLSPGAKESIGFLVMGETFLQLHYTDHDDPYIHMDNETTYDDECKNECNYLADNMLTSELKAKCKDGDGKLYPPYELVSRINMMSLDFKFRITEHPKKWESWVSPLAQKFSHNLNKPGATKLVTNFLLTRLEK